MNEHLSKDPVRDGYMATKEREVMSADQLLYDLDNLRHMLGARPGMKVREWGFRNYFNSSENGPDLESMKRLEALGLVRQGRRFYWHATEAGCKAAGLSEKQRRRALNGD